MALTDDQKAMLRLLSQRGAQGYEDLSALLGVSIDEVHSRAKAAAAQLESEGIPAPSVPEPDGSGGDSPSAAKAEEDLAAKSPPPTPPAEPQEPVPGGEKTPATQVSPSPAPAQPTVPPPPAPAKKRSRPTAPKLALPKDRGARIGVLAGGAVLVLLVILLVTGVLGDGSDSGTSGSDTGNTAANTAAQEAGSGQLTQAVLEPADGGDASGRALFGRSGKNVLLQVEAQGLEPSPQGQSYVVWLARSPQQMLPLAASKVDDSGEIAARYQVPTEVLAFLASGSFDEIAITQIGDSAFRRSVAQARKAKKSPAYTGTAVLRGQITGPIVGLAKKGN
ncbi:MAG TPA: hypothetical protein VFL89_07475 [Solirubrobacterales bacterium]|nr:hypothetical protein [Solirubrobacterales bacterium]